MHCTFITATATLPHPERDPDRRTGIFNHQLSFTRSDMANIKSQKKRNRQNEKLRQRNKSIQSDLKTSIKKVEAAAAAGEPTEDLFKVAQRKIDVAASKGVLHGKTAARKKSRLAASVSTTK
jgi:small subunit ribosomal protein S20